MAPTPIDNTARVWLDYTTCGEPHTAMVRLAGGTPPTDGLAALDALLDVISPLLYELTVTGARQAVINSNISLPIAWTYSATYGTTAGPHQASAYYLDFIARSSNGKRGRLAFFGAIGNADTTGEDFRLTSADNGDIASAVTLMNGASGVFCTIDGVEPTWYPYADIGTNAYWRNRIR